MSEHFYTTGIAYMFKLRDQMVGIIKYIDDRVIFFGEVERLRSWHARRVNTRRAFGLPPVTVSPGIVGYVILPAILGDDSDLDEPPLTIDGSAPDDDAVGPSAAGPLEVD